MAVKTITLRDVNFAIANVRINEKKTKKAKKKKERIEPSRCSYCGKTICVHRSARHSNVEQEPSDHYFCKCRQKDLKCKELWCYYLQNPKTLQSKVLEVLSVNYPKDLSPFEIASALEINQSLINDVLESLVNSGDVISIENEKEEKNHGTI